MSIGRGPGINGIIATMLCNDVMERIRGERKVFTISNERKGKTAKEYLVHKGLTQYDEIKNNVDNLIDTLIQKHGQNYADAYLRTLYSQLIFTLPDNIKNKEMETIDHCFSKAKNQG